MLVIVNHDRGMPESRQFQKKKQSSLPSKLLTSLINSKSNVIVTDHCSLFVMMHAMDLYSMASSGTS